MITAGAKLFMDVDCTDINERVSLSNGIQHIANDTMSYGGMNYLEGYFRPHTPWRKIEKSEAAVLLAHNNEFTSNQDVQLFKLPVAIVEKFQELQVAEMENKATFLQAVAENKSLLNEINSLTDQFIKPIVKQNGSYRFRGVYFSPMNLPTTGYNDSKQLVGLHIDNSNGYKQFIEPPTAIRLCFNLGKAERHFLFVNKTIDQLIEMVEKYKSVDRTRLTDTMLLQTFIKYYDTYPVIKVKQQPYEAYIMPADNLIHDGSTEGSTAVDITMTFLGDFNYLNKAQ